MHGHIEQICNNDAMWPFADFALHDTSDRNPVKSPGFHPMSKCGGVLMLDMEFVQMSPEHVAFKW